MTGEPIPYFIHDATGRIVRTGACYLAPPLQNGTMLVHGSASSNDYYDLSAKKVRPLPPRPSEHHEFDYVAKQWRLNIERAWASVRADRDRRLLASDWTQLPDVPLATKERWATFRQALRDITSQPDPLNISWPSPPA